MALLDELRFEFAEHNVFLHLLLGLVSLGQRLESWLPAKSSGAAPAASDPEATRDDERPLLLLLGLISLHETLMDTTAPIRSSALARESIDEHAPTEPPSRLTDLLR